MAASWRPPAGLVLDGREHGGRLERHRAEDHTITQLASSGVPNSIREAEVEAPSKNVIALRGRAARPKPTGEALHAIAHLDLTEPAAMVPPRDYGPTF